MVWQILEIGSSWLLSKMFFDFYRVYNSVYVWLYVLCTFGGVLSECVVWRDQMVWGVVGDGTPARGVLGDMVGVRDGCARPRLGHAMAIGRRDVRLPRASVLKPTGRLPSRISDGATDKPCFLVL